MVKGQSDNKNLKKKFEDFTYPVGDGNWDAISSRLPEGNPSGFLAGKFSNFTAEPGPHVWSHISALIQPSGEKRPVAWWWYAAAASLLFFVYVGYAVYNSAEAPSQLVQEKVTKTQQTKEGKPADNAVTPLAEDSSNAKAASYTASRETTSASGAANEIDQSGKGREVTSEPGVLAEKTASKVSEDNKPESLQEKDDKNISDRKKRSAEPPLIIADKKRSSSALLAKAARRDPELLGYHFQPNFHEFREAPATAQVSPAEKSKKSSGFYDGTETAPSQNFSLWAGSLMAFAGSGSQDNMEMATYNYEGIGTGSGDGTSNFTTGTSSSQFSPPVYYGVNGEIKFWNRMAAGLGVGFLHMRTTTTHTFWSGAQAVQDISASYISVPVYVKLNFIDRSKFAAYTSMGHGYDILIGQNVSTESNSGLQNSAQVNLPNEEPGNQANLYAGLGMHYKLSRQFGIFAEGSLMHYYHLSDSNFFSQQNYWPGLRFGLLITFD